MNVTYANQSNNSNCASDEYHNSFVSPLSGSWVYPLTTTVGIFGMVTNLINISVFVHPRLKEDSYKFMLASSTSNFFYVTFFILGYVVLMCDCALNSSFFTALFSIAIIDYFTSCLAIFRIFIEITLTIKTYCILSNNTIFNLVKYQFIMIALVIVSLIYYSPICFYSYIDQGVNCDGLVTYGAVATSFGSSKTADNLVIALQSGRIILANVVLSFFNILTANKFRERYLKRKILSTTNSEVPVSVANMSNYI